MELSEEIEPQVVFYNIFPTIFTLERLKFPIDSLESKRRHFGINCSENKETFNPTCFGFCIIASDEKKINASVLISFTALRRTDLVSGRSCAPLTQLLGLTVALLITHFTLSQVYRGSKALYNHDNGCTFIIHALFKLLN